MSYEQDIRDDIAKQTRVMVWKILIIGALTIVALFLVTGCNSSRAFCGTTVGVTPDSHNWPTSFAEKHECYIDKDGNKICK